MSKIIFEESVTEELIEKGGYIIENNGYFIVTIYKVERSHINYRPIDSKAKTFIYDDITLAVAFAKTGKVERW